MTVINGWLTTVGGGSYPEYSNELLSLTVKGRWTQQIPPMPTKRCRATAVCTGTTLVVAGGEGRCGRGLSTVEVMSTENYQWSNAADLPQPMRYASAAVCGDQLCILGGSGEYLYVKSAYTCSLSSLLQSCVPSSLEAKSQRTSSKIKARVWKQIADLLVIRTTCESFHGRLLAIGGVMDSGKLSTAVHMYNSTTNSWEIISHMTTGRCDCFTAVLPDNQLMVVGGETGGHMTDMVEQATVYDD